MRQHGGFSFGNNFGCKWLVKWYNGENVSCLYFKQYKNAVEYSKSVFGKVLISS